MLSLVALACVSAMQGGGDTLRAFRTPASPAFILLGAAPTSVERPGTPQSMVLSLVSALEDNHFPPKRYALEVAPYWLTRHRTLTFEHYAAPGFWQSMVQTLSLSVATVDIPPPDSGTVLGFGLRTAYVSGRDLSFVRALRDTVAMFQDSILDATTQKEELRFEKRLRPVALRLQRALRTERLGWTVEGAAAAAMDFPADIAARGKLSRAALWVTTGYRLTKPKVDLLTVVRLTRDERAAPSQNFLDLGGRFVLDREDLAISGEYVFRSVTASGASRSTYRLSAAADYRLRDDVYLSAAVGRGYDETGAGTAKLVAQLGVDFGLGPVPVISKSLGR